MRSSERNSARHHVNRSAMFAAWLIMTSLAACHSATPLERERGRLIMRRDAARFVIAASTDSTVTFRPFEAHWLKAGMRGHVVDPTERDALIARVTIQRVDSSGTLAVIDGGVSPVSTKHVVLIERPTLGWWRDKRFWIGAGAGVLTGVIATSASK